MYCRLVLEVLALIDIIIVGVGGWEEYTKPCIESIREKMDGKASINIIDNGYNYHDDEWVKTAPYCSMGFMPLSCYAKAINFGVNYTPRICDWLIIINNDVLCTGKIDTAKLDKNTIYGAKKHERWGREWLDGWIFVMHRDLLEDVGEFDENFKVAAFEDADYCFRAQDKGYKVEVIDLPFIHLETSDRLKVDGGWRQDNLDYLKEKHGL